MRGRYVLVALMAVVTLAFCGWVLFRDTTPEPSAATDPVVTPSASNGCDAPARLALLGDSTRDEAAAGGPFADALRAALSGTEVRSFGLNGVSLDRYVTDPVQRQLGKWEPDALEVSIGINDLRLDQSPQRVAQLQADLGGYLDSLHGQFPSAVLVATVPAALNVNDIGEAGYVKPPEAAATVTRDLRSTYLAVASERPWLTLVDAQEHVTGTEADESNPPRFLMDQVHPSPETAATIAGLVAAEFC